MSLHSISKNYIGASVISLYFSNRQTIVSKKVFQNWGVGEGLKKFQDCGDSSFGGIFVGDQDPITYNKIEVF